MLSKLKYKYIRPLKNFFYWGNAFKHSFDGEPWGDLEKFVMLKTKKYLEFTKTRDTYYVGGEKSLKSTKILYETSKRLFHQKFHCQETPYDKEIKELKDIWRKTPGFKEDEIMTLCFRIRVDNKDGSVCYSPIKGSPVADRYFFLSKLQCRCRWGSEKGIREIFNKNLKHFDKLDW